MSIQKDGKIYYTTTEIKSKLKESIRIKAIKVVNEIKNEIINK